MDNKFLKEDLEAAEQASKKLEDAGVLMLEISASKNPAISFIALNLLKEFSELGAKTKRLKEILKEMAE